MGDGSDLPVIIAAMLAAVAVLILALLRAWEDWLRFRRLELGRGETRPLPSQARRRLELIDLRDRVKRLEAIADGED